MTLGDAVMWLASKIPAEQSFRQPIEAGQEMKLDEFIRSELERRGYYDGCIGPNTRTEIAIRSLATALEERLHAIEVRMTNGGL